MCVSCISLHAVNETLWIGVYVWDSAYLLACGVLNEIHNEVTVRQTSGTRLESSSHLALSLSALHMSFSFTPAIHKETKTEKGTETLTSILLPPSAMTHGKLITCRPSTRFPLTLLYEVWSSYLFCHFLLHLATDDEEALIQTMFLRIVTHNNMPTAFPVWLEALLPWQTCLASSLTYLQPRGSKWMRSEGWGWDWTFECLNSQTWGSLSIWIKETKMKNVTLFIWQSNRFY